MSTTHDPVVQRRAEAIKRLGLLERSGDPGLSALCRLTSYVTGAGAAAVHILDAEMQRRIAAENVPLGDHPREDSMCRLVVDGEQRIVCADAVVDPRFGYTSFVRGPAPVRFYLSVPLRTSDDAIVGTLCAFDTSAREVSAEQVALVEDVAQQVVSQIELQRIAIDLGHLACHDALTGVANRLVLADRLGQAFARRLRHGGRVVLAVVDINRFKAINDELGHAVGDEVLVSVARRLSATMRAEDTVARVGGDEFVALAEVEDEVEFERELAERIELALSAPPMTAGPGHPVTASVGCVSAEPGETIAAALVRADLAMYERKAATATGRAR